MIDYKVGDLLEALKSGEVESIAHQANCFHTMRSGIAPLIAGEWPEVLEADRKTIYGDREKLGTCTVAKVKEGHIFNVYGQYHWSRKSSDYGTDYGCLIRGLRSVRDYMDANKISSIGLPLIGCGLAGGNWRSVEFIISTVFRDFTGTVTIYTLNEIKGLPYGMA